MGVRTEETLCDFKGKIIFFLVLLKCFLRTSHQPAKRLKYCVGNPVCGGIGKMAHNPSRSLNDNRHPSIKLATQSIPQEVESNHPHKMLPKLQNGKRKFLSLKSEELSYLALVISQAGGFYFRSLFTGSLFLVSSIYKVLFVCLFVSPEVILCPHFLQAFGLCGVFLFHQRSCLAHANNNQFSSGCVSTCL